MNPSTAVIIRFHFEEDPKSRYYASPQQFEWRFGFFASMCLPRIRRQSGDFDICVWCEPHHKERFELLGCKTFGVKDEYRGWIKPGHEGKDQYHVDFIPWEAVVGLDKYDLQIAIDSDELLLRDDSFDVIRETFKKCPGTGHVSFQSVLFDVPSCQLYVSGYRYAVDKGSPYYALWQPGVPDERYVFLYDESHFKIGDKMDRKYFIADDKEQAHIAASVHDWNASTRLNSAIPLRMPARRP